MMRALPLMMLPAMFIPLQTLADNDDWIGLESEAAQTRAGFLMTQDQQHNSTQNLYLQQTLTDSADIYLNYSRDRLNHPQQTLTSEDFSGEFLLDLNLDWAAAIGYQFQGQAGELEIEQFALRIEYAPYPAFMSLQISSGDATLFARDDLPDHFNPGRSIHSNLSSQQIELGWWFDDFTLSAQYRHFDYQRDITQLETRPLLQLLVKPGALAQSGLLVSQQSSVDLTIPFEQHRFGAHVQSSTSALNHRSIRSLQLDWIHNLGAHFDALFFISRYQGSEPNWTLSAGLEWNG
jgi:hypothetical protein